MDRTPNTPVGMCEVSEGDFWRWVKRTKRNVHPHSTKHYTEWRNPNDSRTIDGWANRGYLGDHDRDDPKVWALSPESKKEL